MTHVPRILKIATRVVSKMNRLHLSQIILYWLLNVRKCKDSLKTVVFGIY